MPRPKKIFTWNQCQMSPIILDFYVRKKLIVIRNHFWVIKFLIEAWSCEIFFRFLRDDSPDIPCSTVNDYNWHWPFHLRGTPHVRSQPSTEWWPQLQIDHLRFKTAQRERLGSLPRTLQGSLKSRQKRQKPQWLQYQKDCPFLKKIRKRKLRKNWNPPSLLNIPRLYQKRPTLTELVTSGIWEICIEIGLRVRAVEGQLKMTLNTLLSMLAHTELRF